MGAGGRMGRVATTCYLAGGAQDASLVDQAHGAELSSALPCQFPDSEHRERTMPGELLRHAHTQSATFGGTEVTGCFEGVFALSQASSNETPFIPHKQFPDMSHQESSETPKTPSSDDAPPATPNNSDNPLRSPIYPLQAGGSRRSMCSSLV